MKFLRNTSLRLIGIYLLVVMFLIYFAEYYIIQYRINVLDETEQKLDFIRSAEISSQQISLMVQRHFTRNEDLSAEIEAKIVNQDHLLGVLSKGGRIDRTDVILKPLKRLPRISFDNLNEYWEEYKSSVREVLSIRENTTPADAAEGDSTYSNTVVTTPAVISDKAWRAAVLKEESLSLTLSQWYDNLFNDVETEVMKEKSSVHRWVIAIIVFDVALLTLIFLVFERHVLRPLNTLRISTSNHQQMSDSPNNEIGKLSNQINETLENLKDATDFVTAIGQGNLDIDYKATLDSGYNHGKNKLADSLIDMQGKLKSLNEEERKRQWANEGLAKFVDIMR